jgi:hypothetical protein
VLLYLVLGVWGLIIGDGDSIADVLPVSTADNIAHLVLGLAGIAAALTTPRPGLTTNHPSELATSRGAGE